MSLCKFFWLLVAFPTHACCFAGVCPCFCVCVSCMYVVDVCLCVCMFVFVLVYSCICACTCVHVLACVNPERCVGVFSRLGDWSILLEKAQYYANPGLLAFLSALVHIAHNHIQAQSTPISWASCSLDLRFSWTWWVCATALLKVAALCTLWLLFAPYGCPCIMCAPSCSHMAALCTMWLPMH